jgi:hypothetical protein
MKRALIALACLPVLGGCALTTEDVAALLYYNAARNACEDDYGCEQEVERYQDAWNEQRRRERQEERDDQP